MTADLLAEIESAIAGVARARGPAVVGIDRRAGRGSGVVVAQDEVLTLASNLRQPAGEVAVAFGAVPSAAAGSDVDADTDADADGGGGGGADAAAPSRAPGSPGAAVTGVVAGIDALLDLALIRVPTGAIEPLDWAPGAPGLGQAVIALANPAGQGLRASLGFVAAVDRSFRGPRGRVVVGALEHTAPLPPGSAGGPLLDTSGRVVALNAVRVAGGLILALPGPAVSERAEHLRGAPADPPQLGVSVVSSQVARRLRRAVGLPERDGVLIHEVASGSPAEHALLRAGDLVVAAAGAPVDGVDALYAALDRVPTGGTIDLRVVRGVEERDFVVRLGGSS